MFFDDFGIDVKIVPWNAITLAGVSAVTLNRLFQLTDPRPEDGAEP